MRHRIESFGPAGYARRDLHLLDVESAEVLDETSLQFDRHSAILLVWNADSATEAERHAVVEFLLAEGAASVCCWGDGCDSIYTTLNERILHPDPDSIRYSSAIMATAHRKESFEEVLWYLLWCTIPDERFEASCRDALVLTIGLPDLADRARGALADPEAFSNRVLREAETD